MLEIVGLELEIIMGIVKEIVIIQILSVIDAIRKDI